MLLFKYCILLSVLVTLSLCLINKEKENDKKIPFLWGTATAAYQIEGSVNVDGRSASIWDTFSQIPGKIFNNDTGAVADDSYVQFRKDIQLMKSMGVNSHRFSFSWSRILPDESGKINQKAIRHYNEFINELLRNDIQPMVTLYHWDLPDYLEKKYNGWLSHDIVKDFAYYSEVCFNAFGDRVKMWITINEPWTFCYLGYVAGAFAPGRCSDRSKCDAGDSATEGYIAAHNVLNAHAASVNVYRTKFQPHQHGEIGITLNHDWNEPQTSSPINIAAAERKNLFSMGWFGDPIVFGKYPKVMRDIVGTRLPEFTTEESDLLKGSFDFWALNHYSTKYVSQGGNIIHPLWDRGWSVDINFTESRYSVTHALIGPQADSPWLNMVPWGFYRTLRWSHDRYAYAGGRNARTGEPIKPFKIYVTENGCDVPGESELPRKEALEDTFRIEYYRSYLSELERAIADGLDIRGYMAWSLLDNFEWADGYKFRFGLHYVDYTSSDRQRYAKDSAHWYSNHIRARASYSRVPVVSPMNSSGSSGSGSGSGGDRVEESKYIVSWYKSSDISMDVQIDGNDSMNSMTTTSTSLLGTYVRIYQQLFNSVETASHETKNDNHLIASSLSSSSKVMSAEKDNTMNNLHNTRPTLVSYITKAFRLAFLVPLPII